MRILSAGGSCRGRGVSSLSSLSTGLGARLGARRLRRPVDIGSRATDRIRWLAGSERVGFSLKAGGERSASQADLAGEPRSDSYPIGANPQTSFSQAIADRYIFADY